MTFFDYKDFQMNYLTGSEDKICWGEEKKKKKKAASGREENIVGLQMSCSCNRRLRVASCGWLILISPGEFSYRDLLGLMITCTFV